MPETMTIEAPPAADQDPFERKRIVSRELPAAAKELLAVEPQVCDEVVQPLCEESPSTFVQSLLVAKWQREITELIVRNGGEVPACIATPFSIISHANVVQRTSGEQIPVPRALLIHAVAKQSALVLEGDLTGLFLNGMRYKNDTTQPFIVNRFFNDDPVTVNSFPHIPKFGKRPEGVAYEAGYDAVFDRTLEWYLKKKREYVDEKIREYADVGKTLMMSDLMKELCDDMGVGLDEDAFIFTRSEEPS